MIEKVLSDLWDAGYEGARVYGQRPNIVDVFVPGYRPPAETCNEEVADIIIPLPATFPAAAPYGFFAVTPISRKSGTWRNTSKAKPHTSATFFSRQCPEWDPAKHDILTILAFINLWLSS